MTKEKVTQLKEEDIYSEMSQEKVSDMTQEKVSDITQEKVSVFKKIKNVLEAITIEPAVVLMITSMMLSSTAMQTLLLEKACRVDLNLSNEICDALRRQDSDDNTENERIVQEYISKYVTYKSIIASVLPCLLLIFSGGWMDITGRRKVMMLVPVLGQVLYETNNIINVVFFTQLNAQVLVFSEAVLGNIFGGFSVLFLAIYSYITDITTEHNRTYRLGLVSFGIYIGMPLGMSLSGVLLRNFGYLSVFITALCLASVNSFYIMFKLRDPPRTKEYTVHDNRGLIYFLKTFFRPKHFVNSLKVVFKKTTTNRRTMLCILILTSLFIMGPTYGEISIMYLSTRYRFNWNEFQFSMFQTFNMIVTTIGNIFAILLLSKKLGWHDALIGVISLVSKIAAGLLYCFAGSGIVFLMGPLVDALNGTAGIVVRSILTKTVERHEISRLNSIISIAEVLLPMAFVSLYVAIYTSTLTTMPGAVFLVSAGMAVPPLSVFGWMFLRHRRGLHKETNKEAEN